VSQKPSLRTFKLKKMANPTNMDSGFDFQTWNNSERGSITHKYKGAQGINSRNAADDSLQTSEGTWVIVFDSSNYTGNCWQIGDDKYFDNLHDNEIYDSNGNDTKNHWQGNINSFILYKNKPSWFVAGSTVVPSNDQLFELNGTQVLLCEDAHYLGNNNTLSGPFTCLDSSSIFYRTNSERYMSGAYAITSLKTGPNAWLVVYDHSYMAGDFKKIAPNSGPSNNTSSNYSDLKNIDRDNLNGDSDGNWKNQINSFLIYNYLPEFWNTKYASPYIDFATLYGYYPSPTSEVSDNKVEYMVEDSKYTIDCPTLQYQSADQTMTGVNYIGDVTTDLPTTGWTKYNVQMGHVNSLAFDDKVNFDIYFDNAGNIIQIQNFTWTSNGAYDIPSTVIFSVDVIGKYLSTSLNLMGIETNAINDFIDVFNFVCNVFNTIAIKVYQFSDNGGQFYFLPVICHTINRIAATVATQYDNPLYVDSSDVRHDYVLSFDNNNFPAALNTIIDGTASDWAVKQDLDGGTFPFNQVTEYTYKGCNYRTWYQESSVSAELGIFVSCKIDYEIGDDSQDDHIILLMGFTIPETADQTTPVLAFAKTTVQFTDASLTNIITPAYNGYVDSPNYSADIIGSVYQFISNELTNDILPVSGTQQGRQYLADITKANMLAIAQCTHYGASTANVS
jgi:hypothetical protein